MNTQTISEPSRAEIDQLTGAVVLEFGAAWCQYCQAMQHTIASELLIYPNIQYIKIEDGKGRKLGRSFNVKLWPTLIFINDGVELKRLVRQFSAAEISAALVLISE